MLSLSRFFIASPLLLLCLPPHLLSPSLILLLTSIILGMASTVRRDTSAGRKVGLIAARRTGRLTGAKNKEK